MKTNASSYGITRHCFHTKYDPHNTAELHKRRSNRQIKKLFYLLTPSNPKNVQVQLMSFRYKNAETK